MRLRARFSVLGALLGATTLVSMTALDAGGVVNAASAATTNVYFDQTEETDFWQTGNPAIPDQVTTPIPTGNQLVKPWDTNGQLCIFPDGSGRFTIGYNPTGLDQTNDQGGKNGGVFLPRKQPPAGEAIYNKDGSYSASGTGSSNNPGIDDTTNNLHVPGPYQLTSSSSEWSSLGVTGPDVTGNGLLGGSLGQSGDIPPDTAGGGAFNNNGTFTGCAFSPTTKNLFAVDLGNSQGSYPTLSSGRLIEWFADSGYRGVCIIYGPNQGGDVWNQADSEGVNTHHVDGTGGLQQPGMLASDSSGNIYVPVDATNPVTDTSSMQNQQSTQFIPNGQVWKFSNLPRTEADCPTTQSASATNWQPANGDQTTYHADTPSVFINAVADGLPFPGAITNDPKCNCWAVDNIFFGAIAVAFFDRSGSLLTSPAPVPANYAVPNSDALAAPSVGEVPQNPSALPNPGIPAGTYNPFGISFDSNGDLFMVDIGVAVYPVGTIESQSLGAGPANSAGRLLEFTFSNGVAGPPTVIASGENYPVSVTTCDQASYAQQTGNDGASCPAPS